MSTPDPDSRRWAQLGEQHAVDAVEHFQAAQRDPDLARRESALRRAQRALNTAIYCLRNANETLAGERGNARRRRVAVQIGEPLTVREMETARWLTTGAGNREIAEHLGISEGTVKTHVEHILAKLGLRTRGEAIVWVVRNLPEWQPETIPRPPAS